MSTGPFTTDSRGGALRYLQAFRARWLLITAFTLLAAASAAALTLSAAKRYDASADVLVTPLQANDDTFQGFSLFRESVSGSSVVVTAARVMRADQIRSAAFRRLGPEGRGVSIDVTPLSQAEIVTVKAEGPSARSAARAANVYARVAIQQRSRLFQSELEQRIGHLTQQLATFPRDQRSGNFAYASIQQQLGTLRGALGTRDPTLRLLNPAVPPAAASWPRPKLTIAVAFLAALLLGSGLAVALDVVNPRVSREDELKLDHRLPILARIPRISSRTVQAYLTGNALLPSDAWKGYRTLRAVLATAGGGGGFPKSVLVTSATPGDGKTMTALNLAITLAAADMRVILVDGDSHRPMIGTIFNVTGRRDGFMRLLAGRTKPTDALVSAPTYPRLRLLLSTREQAYHVHALQTEQFTQMLRTLEQECDVVVIDSPPLPEVAEALGMADAAETVLLSVRLGHTRRDKLDELRELLARRGVAPLGFVVTTRERARSGESAYDYSYRGPEPGVETLRRRRRAGAVGIADEGSSVAN